MAARSALFACVFPLLVVWTGWYMACAYAARGRHPPASPRRFHRDIRFAALFGAAMALAIVLVYWQVLARL